MAIIKAANPLHTGTVDTDNLWWTQRAWDDHSLRWISKNHPNSGDSSVRSMVAKQVLRYRPYNLPGLVPSAEWLLEFYQTMPRGRDWNENWPSVRADQRVTSAHEYLERLNRGTGYGRRGSHLDVAANSILATAKFFDAEDARQAIKNSYGMREIEEHRYSDRAVRYVLSAQLPTRVASAWAALASNPAIAEMNGFGGRGNYLMDYFVFQAVKLFEDWGKRAGGVSPSGFYLGRRVLEGVVANMNASMEVLQKVADTLEPTVQHLVDNPTLKPWHDRSPWMSQATKTIHLLGEVYLHPNWTGETKHWESHVNPTLRGNITRLTTFAPHPTLFADATIPNNVNTPKHLLEREGMMKELTIEGNRADKWESYVSAYPNSKHKMQFPPPVFVGPGLGYVTSMGEGEDAVPLEWIDLILS